MRIALLLLFAILCCGCGARPTEISGNVTLGGQPLEKGTIMFVPADGQGPTAAEVIANGSYLAHVKQGKYKVQIFGYRKTGERHANKGDPNSPMVDISDQIVPERYNAATTLTLDTQSGQPDGNFALDKK